MRYEKTGNVCIFSKIGKVPSHVYSMLLYMRNEMENRIYSYLLLFSQIKSVRILKKQITDYLG